MNDTCICYIPILHISGRVGRKQEAWKGEIRERILVQSAHSVFLPMPLWSFVMALQTVIIFHAFLPPHKEFHKILWEEVLVSLNQI